VPNRRADTIRSRVSAADDEDAFAFCVDGIHRRLACQKPILSAKEFQGEMDAGEMASGDFEIARSRSADRNDDRVTRALQIFGGNVDADFGIRPEYDAFGFENLSAARDDRFVEFEVRDAVAEKSADIVALLVNRDGPTPAAKRDRRGESGGARADDCGLLSVFGRGRTGEDPPVRKGGFDDELLALADHHRFFIELMGAAGFAQRRTDSGGELREVAVDGEQIVRLAEVAAGDGSVLLGDEVPQRTSETVAEGDCAG